MVPPSRPAPTPSSCLRITNASLSAAHLLIPAAVAVFARAPINARFLRLAVEIAQDLKILYNLLFEIPFL
jgi:hypothetical protein